MNWYEHLYMGEKAKKNRYAILQGLREERWQPEVYVIMPPENGNNILEILPSAMLHAFPRQRQEGLVIGVAVTYWEALEVARGIVDDLYRKTGGFCLGDLIEGMAYAHTEQQSGPDSRKKRVVRGEVC